MKVLIAPHPLHAPTWMNLEHTMLSENKHNRQVQFIVWFSLYEMARIGKSRVRRKIRGCQGLEERGERGGTANRYKGFFLDR